MNVGYYGPQDAMQLRFLVLSAPKQLLFLTSSSLLWFPTIFSQVPPHEEDDSAVKVETRFSPVHISLDENQGIMHTHAWFSMVI